MSGLLSNVGKQRINAEARGSALCDGYRRADGSHGLPSGPEQQEKLVLGFFRTQEISIFRI